MNVNFVLSGKLLCAFAHSSENSRSKKTKQNQTVSHTSNNIPASSVTFNAENWSQRRESPAAQPFYLAAQLIFWRSQPQLRVLLTLLQYYYVVLNELCRFVKMYSCTYNIRYCYLRLYLDFSVQKFIFFVFLNLSGSIVSDVWVESCYLKRVQYYSTKCGLGHRLLYMHNVCRLLTAHSSATDYMSKIMLVR